MWVVNPQALAERLDFPIDLPDRRSSGTTFGKTRDPGHRTGAAVYLSLPHSSPLTEILDSGFDVIRERICEGLTEDTGTTDLGLTIASIRIVALRPEKEVEKALQTPAREAIQQNADEATFKRRAQAVEKERAIAENELQTQIDTTTARYRHSSAFA